MDRLSIIVNHYQSKFQVFDEIVNQSLLILESFKRLAGYLAGWNG